MLKIRGNSSYLSHWFPTFLCVSVSVRDPKLVAITSDRRCREWSVVMVWRWGSCQCPLCAHWPCPTHSLLLGHVCECVRTWALRDPTEYPPQSWFGSCPKAGNQRTITFLHRRTFLQKEEHHHIYPTVLAGEKSGWLVYMQAWTCRVRQGVSPITPKAVLTSLKISTNIAFVFLIRGHVGNV